MVLDDEGKPGDHWAEIREREVTTFRAIEYLVFVDGSLLESQLFYHGREAAFRFGLASHPARCVADPASHVGSVVATITH